MVNITEEQMKSYMSMYNWAKNEGCPDSEADALGSLISWASGNRAIKTSILTRWRELGIIDEDDAVVLDKDCIEGDGIAWLLLANTYSGLLERRINEEGVAIYKETPAGKITALQIAYDNSPMFKALDIMKELSGVIYKVSKDSDKKKLQKLNEEIKEIQGKILMRIAGAKSSDENAIVAKYKRIRKELNNLKDIYIKLD